MKFNKKNTFHSLHFSSDHYYNSYNFMVVAENDFSYTGVGVENYLL
jgi:hypothetical protein